MEKSYLEVLAFINAIELSHEIVIDKEYVSNRTHKYELYLNTHSKTWCIDNLTEGKTVLDSDILEELIEQQKDRNVDWNEYVKDIYGDMFTMDEFEDALDKYYSKSSKEVGYGSRELTIFGIRFLVNVLDGVIVLSVPSKSTMYAIRTSIETDNMEVNVVLNKGDLTSILNGLYKTTIHRYTGEKGWKPVE